MALDSEVSVLEDGVFFLEDAEVGRKVHEFKQQRYPFQTEAGLEFCRLSTLEDKRIRSVIESIFGHSKLALLKVFGPKPDTVFTLLNNPSSQSSEVSNDTNRGKNKVKVILVQLFPGNCTVSFYKRSHLYCLRAQAGKTGLLQVPPESLEREDINLCKVTFKEGGFAIIDGRLAFQMISGHTIVVGFAIDEELEFWGKMRFPEQQDIISKIQEMESKTIGMNVEFVNVSSTNKNSTSTT